MTYEETIEDIDAEAAAVTDEHVTSRLHDVLARALMTRLPELERQWEAAYAFPAEPGRADDVKDLTAVLHGTEQRLRHVQAQVREAEARHQHVRFRLAVAERRLSLMRRSGADVDTGGDPTIKLAFHFAEEILNDANAAADRIISDARAAAEGILRKAGG
jgi:hypothetical protein